MTTSSPKPMSVVDQYKKPTVTVRIGSGEAQDRINKIRVAITAAKVGDPGLSDPTPQLERDLAEATTVADDDAIVFTFEALSGDEMEALKLAHPTSNKDLAFDPITFAPALIAAACIKAGDQDGLTVKEAAEIWDTFSAGDCEQLYAAAWGVTNTAHLRPFSVTDTGNPDQNSALNSTTALLEVLDIASS